MNQTLYDVLKDAGIISETKTKDEKTPTKDELIYQQIQTLVDRSKESDIPYALIEYSKKIIELYNLL